MAENARNDSRAKADVRHSVAKQHDERLAPLDLASTFDVGDGAARRPNSSQGSATDPPRTQSDGLARRYPNLDGARKVLHRSRMPVFVTP